MFKKHLFTVIVCLFLLSSHTAIAKLDHNVPDGQNICHLFTEHPYWFWAAEKAQQHWHVPISELMAIIYQESHYVSDAAPQRLKLWHIPWLRKTSALGYAQATNATWQLYCRLSGRLSADRSDFGDAIDFVAWYVSYAHARLHLDKTDTYRIYLAYHEGIGGYRSNSYAYKPWLKRVARKVDHQAKKYHRQLQQCFVNLPKKPHWIFSF